MKRSGNTDLPLHPGKVPPWLFEQEETRISPLHGGRTVFDKKPQVTGTPGQLALF